MPELIMLRAPDNSLVEIVRADDGTTTVTPEVLEGEEWVRGEPVVMKDAAELSKADVIAIPAKGRAALAAFTAGADLATGEISVVDVQVGGVIVDGG
jgi:hypothetical protein